MAEVARVRTGARLTRIGGSAAAMGRERIAWRVDRKLAPGERRPPRPGGPATAAMGRLQTFDSGLASDQASPYTALPALIWDMPAAQFIEERTGGQRVRSKKALEGYTLDTRQDRHRAGRLLAVSLAATNPRHLSGRRRRPRRSVTVGVLICGLAALIVAAAHFWG